MFHVRALRALVVPLAMAGSLAVLPGASAEPSDVLTFTPGHGRDTSPVRVYTSRACPPETQYMDVVAIGHGFGAQGQVVVTTNHINYSVEHPFSVPLQDTMRGTAANVGATLVGDYRFELRCMDQYTTTTYRMFTGTMHFSDPTRWTAATPPEAQLTQTSAPGKGNYDAGNYGVTGREVPVMDHPVLAGNAPAPVGPSSTASGQAAGGKTPRASATAVAPVPLGAERAPATTGVSQPRGGHTWMWWLIPAVGGFLLLAGGVRALRRTAAVPPPNPTEQSRSLSTHQ